MASITKNNGESTMADEEESDDSPETQAESRKGGSGLGGGGAAAGTPNSGGFFHIYKSGQGYWTRMCTAFGGAFLVLMIANFLYTYLPTWSDAVRLHKPVLFGIILAVIAILSFIIFRITNKPTNVDFLIATDSEMKKVNWTSREELIGSTKIVIIFVFLITAILFGIDIVFGYLFYFLKVLKQPPF